MEDTTYYTQRPSTPVVSEEIQVNIEALDKGGLPALLPPLRDVFIQETLDIANELIELAMEHPFAGGVKITQDDYRLSFDSTQGGLGRTLKMSTKVYRLSYTDEGLPKITFE